MKTTLPSDSEQLLNGMQRHLGVLLQRANDLERTWGERSLAVATMPDPAPVMERIHHGFDRRLANLQTRLQELDDHLAAIEQEAQALQTAARSLRQQPNPQSVAAR